MTDIAITSNESDAKFIRDNCVGVFSELGNGEYKLIFEFKSLDNLFTGTRCLERLVNPLPLPPHKTECDHNFVEGHNEVATDFEICTKCHQLRPQTGEGE